MQTMRDFLGAWLIVGALGLAVIGAWGNDTTSSTDARDVACDDGVPHDSVAALQGADVPHGGWRPLPDLTGLPSDDGDRLASYDAAEERNIRAVGPVGEHDVVLAQGSSTNLNPTSMC